MTQLYAIYKRLRFEDTSRLKLKGTETVNHDDRNQNRKGMAILNTKCALRQKLLLEAKDIL